METINELGVLVLSYHLLIFNDYVVNDEIQYKTGWSLILITVFLILFNSVVTLKMSWNSLKLWIRRLKNILKQKRRNKNKILAV